MPEAGADLANEVSPLLIPIWHRSADDSLIIGRDGFVFLYTGSNDLASLYTVSEDDDLLKHIVKTWISVIAARTSSLRARSICFVQLIIPEKSTALPEYAPPELTPITPHLRLIEEELSRHEFKNDTPSSYLSVRSLPEFRNENFPFYMKTDSHFSTFGAFSTVKALLLQAGVQYPTHAEEIIKFIRWTSAAIRLDKASLFSGDLSRRFFDVPLVEYWQDISCPEWEATSKSIVLVENVIPEKDQHIGIRMVWHNPNAPIKLKLIVFGNSFCERGAASRGLSWWFKHIFSDFHFLWQPDMDYKYIELEKPDIVFCQTVERFLKVVPTS